MRVAGNVISAEILGTLQYAGVHLRTPLFVVLGHEGLRRRAGRRSPRNGKGRFTPNALPRSCENVRPAAAGRRRTWAPERSSTAAVEANVRWSMQQLRETPEGRARMAEGVMKLVGAIYELKTGRVRFLH